MEPGTIVKPTVKYAQFMTRHGCRAPYDGVVLSADERFVRVVWNNADGHAMYLKVEQVEPQIKRLSLAETAALEVEANKLGGESWI